MRIADIDKNLNVESKIENDNLIWLDCREKPFHLTGLVDYTGGVFTRMPAELMEKLRPELAWLGKHTSGGRLRFRTNSEFIALNAVLPSVDLMPHMPLTGSSGFDVYAGKTLEMFATPPNVSTPAFEKMSRFYTPADKDGFRDITINFPLYNRVSSLAIGLDKNAVVKKPKKTKYGKVVFYGSSITQGGVASRPGNNYANILAKWLDFELINLGFSGNAFGDELIADYIASIPMDAFVMDYDFNSRSLDELRATHEPMYRKVRAAQPNAKIIMISNPVPDIYCHVKGSDPRLEIITETYNKAVSEGDDKVWLINGATMLGKSDRDTCTVDNCHPNDLGFFRMAETVKPVLSKALKVK